MHKFILSAADFAQQGFCAANIVKTLNDAGYHPPTMYFPLIAKGAFMTGPVKMESRKNAGWFYRRDEWDRGQGDEVTSARKPILKYEDGE